MLDAIARALVRMLVTRRRLLEWVTADRAENGHADAVERGAPHVAGAGRRAGHRRRWSRSSRPDDCCSRAPSSSCGSSRRRSSTSPDCRSRTATRVLGPERADAVPRGRAPHLAVLRRTGRPRGSLAGARQLSGRPPRRHRAPDVADQHRAAAALDAGGARSRLPQLRGRARSARADVRHAPAHAAVSRPLLQLVRHPDAGAARAGIHLDRRQRQPRRLPADAALRAGVARRVRAAHRRQRARRARGCDQPLRGRGGRAQAAAARRAD